MSGRHPLASRAFKHFSAKQLDESAAPGAAPSITPEDKSKKEDKSQKLDLVLFRVYQIHQNLNNVHEQLKNYDDSKTGIQPEKSRKELLRQLEALEAALFLLTASISPDKKMVEQLMEEEFGKEYEKLANNILAETAYYLAKDSKNIGAKDPENLTKEERMRFLPQNWSDLQTQHDGVLTAEEIKVGAEKHVGMTKMLFLELMGKKQNLQYQMMYGLSEAQETQAAHAPRPSDFQNFVTNLRKNQKDPQKDIPPFNSKTNYLEGHITLKMLETILSSYKKRLLELFHNRAYAGRGYSSKFGTNVRAFLHNATDPVAVNYGGAEKFTLSKVPVVSLGAEAISLPWFSSNIGSTIQPTLSFFEAYFKTLRTEHPALSFAELLATHSNGLNKGEENYNKNSEGKLVNEIVLSTIPFGMNPHSMAAWCRQVEELAKILGIAFRIDWAAIRRQPAVQHSQALAAQLDDVEDSMARYAKDFGETIKKSIDDEIEMMAQSLGLPLANKEQKRTPEEQHDILREYVFGIDWKKQGAGVSGNNQAQLAAAQVKGDRNPSPVSASERNNNPAEPAAMTGTGTGGQIPSAIVNPPLPTPTDPEAPRRELLAEAAEKRISAKK